MKRILLLLLPLFLFLGCTRVVYKPIYKVKRVYYKPPKQLTDYNITVPHPPVKQIYIDSDPIARENLLTFYVIDLLKTINKYKEKEHSLKDWYKKIDKETSEVKSH